MKKIKRFSMKFWLGEIDAYMVEHGLPTMTWEEVLQKEGGYGSSFFKTIEETRGTNTHPGRWFDSGQKDMGLYSEPHYIYSLFFGARQISSQVYKDFAQRHQNETVNDVGGSIFTAVVLLEAGVRQVFITNVGDSPQLDFAGYIIDKYKLPIMIVEEPVEDAATIMSEYLEHFERPLVEWIRVMQAVGEQVEVACANSFCTPAYGHFCPVIIDGKLCKDKREANVAFKNSVALMSTKMEVRKLFNKAYISAEF